MKKISITAIILSSLSLGVMLLFSIGLPLAQTICENGFGFLGEYIDFWVWTNVCIVMFQVPLFVWVLISLLSYLSGFWALKRFIKNRSCNKTFWIGSILSAIPISILMLAFFLNDWVGP